MTKGATHIIVGNSAAALSAIRAIRRYGDERPILLVSTEKELAYSPVLTTYYIAGQIEKEGLYFVEPDFYRRHQVEVLLGRKAALVEPERQRLILDNGKRLTYQNLLIASGASARALGSVEPDAAGFVSCLRTIKDAERIRALAARAKEVVITGAGLVSLQTIKAIADRDLKITVVVGSGQVLSQQMDWECAALIQRRLEAKGVEILFGRAVERVSRAGGRALVHTSYGERLPADLVVVGKGVTPNLEMTEGTPIKTDWGILVDNAMRTNVEGVFAAGDVTQGRNDITGRQEVIATWFNACAQGEVAGANMAGRDMRREGQIRENVTTLMGLVVASIGESKANQGRFQEIRRIDREKNLVRKLFFKGPVLVGALLIGRFFDLGVIRHCIANRVDLSPWKGSLAAAPLDFAKLLSGQGFEWPQFTQTTG